MVTKRAKAKPTITLVKKDKTLPKIKKIKVNKKKLLLSLKNICSKLANQQANGECEICHKAGSQAHHHFSKKAFPHLQFELGNLLWLCFFCHIRRIHQQGQYELARDALIVRLGSEGFQDLKKLAYKKYSGIKTKSIDSLVELEKQLSALLQSQV